MSRRKKCVLSAFEIQQQPPVDLGAMMKTPLNPASRKLPKTREKAPRNGPPSEIELRRLAANKAFGGLVPVRVAGSTARETRARLVDVASPWNGPKSSSPQTCKDPEEPISGSL